MNPKSRLLVVDTNLLVSALFVGSAVARGILERMLHEAVLCFCSETFAELEARSTLSKFDCYTRQEDRLKAVEALGKIGLFTVITDPVSICRDPKDDIFLALAGAIKADAIISGDQDLLVLGNFEGIPIITPREWSTRMNGVLD